MKQFVYLLFFGIVIFSIHSCKEAENNEVISDNYRDYFFPTDSLVPYVYVFRDDNAPLDERFFRMYRLQNETDSSFVVERFNSTFRITEGFTYSLNDSLTVIDHMIVDRDGLKRRTKLTEQYNFPVLAGTVARFTVDFPGVIDSTVIVQDSKKHVFDADFTYVLFGKEVPALLVKDTIRMYELNQNSKEVRESVFVTDNIYAKGYGLVEWGTEDKLIVYSLRTILSDKWWSENAQAPQVRF
jgi:hypothetical protein